MKQAIAGCAPPDLAEVTVMTVWPTLGAWPFGRFLGRLYVLGGKNVFVIGKLIALASIPIVLPLFFATLNPFSVKRYRLTNRRVTIQRGIRGIDERWAELDRFDSIEIVVQPGQAWYHAGDLVFRNGAVETLRLEGVSRPETFRQTCLKARNSFVGVKKAMAK